LAEAPDQFFRGGILFGYDFGADLAGYFAEYLLQPFLHFRRSRCEQALPHGIGGARQQLAEQTRGDVGPARQRRCQPVVAVGQHHQPGIAAGRQSSAFVGCHLVGQVRFTPIDQHFRDRFVYSRTTGYLELMLPAFGSGKLDQLVIGQSRGMLQHRTGDLDGVVRRKPANDASGSIGDQRQPRAQFSQGLALDVGN
jgi:hypothetical protein